MGLSTVVRITDTPSQCGKSFAFMAMARGFAQGGVRPVMWFEPTVDFARDRIRRHPDFFQGSGVFCAGLSYLGDLLPKFNEAELVIIDNWHMVGTRQRNEIIDLFETGSRIMAPRMMFLLG